MRRILLAVVVISLLAGATLVIATVYRSQPDFDDRLEGDPLASLVIAPATTAVTLARIASEDGGRVVLVTRAGPEGLDAVDLEAVFDRPFRDAVEAFAVLGFDALAGAAAGAPTLRTSFESLGLPLDAGDAHIAAGTNYRAHAEEVGREDGPFLFPKLTRPTRWSADVPIRARLDYEAEICAVPLTRHTASDPASLGYLLCNDFTDRWTLVRRMRPGEPMGITGFADGKGGDGMLPVGALLVVPRDDDGFWRDVGLELYVGGRLRQRARGGQMIWSPAEIVSRALEACDVAYHHRSGSVPLTDCDGIPPRTLVLTGTPAGVLFDVVTLWSPSAYLEPGDEVVTAATHLGILRNRVRRGR